MTEITGIDHIYVAVSDLVKSERFYDRVLGVVFGFRKNEFVLGGDRHVQYFNKYFGFVLRPARVHTDHQPYAAGLHHFCFRVDSKADVQAAADELRIQGIDATAAKLYPHYAPDYMATFFEDPDGVRLEVTNYRQERRDRHDLWDEQRGRRSF
jgi:catechol 2,3-dioxygenase-like lactoylglutathione lyase family enzyme